MEKVPRIPARGEEYATPSVRQTIERVKPRKMERASSYPIQDPARVERLGEDPDLTLPLSFPPRQ